MSDIHIKMLVKIKHTRTHARTRARTHARIASCPHPKKKDAQSEDKCVNHYTNEPTDVYEEMSKCDGILIRNFERVLCRLREIKLLILRVTPVDRSTIYAAFS